MRHRRRAIAACRQAYGLDPFGLSIPNSYALRLPPRGFSMRYCCESVLPCSPTEGSTEGRSGHSRTSLSLNTASPAARLPVASATASIRSTPLSFFIVLGRNTWLSGEPCASLTYGGEMRSERCHLFYVPGNSQTLPVFPSQN